MNPPKTAAQLLPTTFNEQEREDGNPLFSPIFAKWLHRDLSQLEYDHALGPIQSRTLRLLPAIDLFFRGDELREFYFVLGVDYHNLPGGGKRNKARELCDWMRCHGRRAEPRELLFV